MIHLKVFALLISMMMASGRHIVMFNKIDTEESLVQLIRECIGSAFEHFARDLSGGLLSYPNTKKDEGVTDFVVIFIKYPHNDISRLERHNNILYVSPDRILTREPLSFSLSSKGRPIDVADQSEAQFLWEEKVKGDGAKVAILDSGLEPSQYIQNIGGRSDWTGEGNPGDVIGHGTFIAGLIASSHPKCKGISPLSVVYSLKVFNKRQQSRTSWFLDAFNHVLALDVDIVNLSIGGPDYLDGPFIEKIRQITSTGIVVVSSVGNDGPLFGTLYNPADQMDVLGVGGASGDNVAEYSSRGMTLWELPKGYGRIKPDVIAQSHKLLSLSKRGSCRTLSGTSVASPVVSGTLALLMSSQAFPKERRNIAFIRQLIASTARRVDASVFEQGYGLIGSIPELYKSLHQIVPLPIVTPASLDLRPSCTYLYPLCSQPLYITSKPLRVNFTISNPLSVSSAFDRPPQWTSSYPLISATFQWSSTLWPWTGYLYAEFSLLDGKIDAPVNVEGVIHIYIQNHSISIDVALPIIPTPERSQRLLWDQFHNLNYPLGYFPSDHTDHRQNMLDWNGDHPHTNFMRLYKFLRSKGFFIEVLDTDFTCFDASLYGALLLVDPEESFFERERDKLFLDIVENNMSLIVFADWYDRSAMDEMEFIDFNSQRTWVPETGGSNVPSLNYLLDPFFIQLSETSLNGRFRYKDKSIRYESGTSIIKAPASSLLLQTVYVSSSSFSLSRKKYSVLALVDIAKSFGKLNAGKIAVYGDSSCIDSSFVDVESFCDSILLDMVLFATRGEESIDTTSFLRSSSPIDEKFMFRPSKSLVHSKVKNGTTSCSFQGEVNTQQKDMADLITKKGIRSSAFIQKYSFVTIYLLFTIILLIAFVLFYHRRKMRYHSVWKYLLNQRDPPEYKMV